MSRLAFAIGLTFFASTPVFAQTVKRADLKPGLVFAARDAAHVDSVRTTRLEPLVGLTLNAGESVHPQSTGGDGSFTWTGYIQIITAGKYKFDTALLGKLNVRIDGVEVLAGEVVGDAAKPVAGAEIELKTGIQLFEVQLLRMSKGCRVELQWQGPGFFREPIPYFFFGHTLKQRPAEYAADLKKEHGRFLFEEHACIKCHVAEKGDAMAKTLVERRGPSLTEIGKRAYPGWIDAWLKDPKAHRPQTTMPKVFADNEVGASQRYAVTAYLTSLGGPLPEFKPPTATTKPERDSIERGGKLYITTGCATCHGDQITAPPVKKIKDEDDDPKDAPKPEDSLYGLGTKAGAQSYYTLGSIGSKTRPEPLAKYLLDPLATNAHGRMPRMGLSAAEATDIAKFLCRVTDDKLNPAMPAEPKGDPTVLVDLATGANLKNLKRSDAWKEAGKWLLTSKGCTNCHEVKPGGAALPVKENVGSKLATLAKMPEKGCITGTEIPATAPKFGFDKDQQEALTAFLKGGLTGAGAPSPVYAARTSIKRFNCLNCHNRDGEGSIDEGLANKMKTLEKADNADDIQPPRLTGVGHKMRTSWLKKVLLAGGRARPWMTLQMPEYGQDCVGTLPEALPALEGAVTDDAIGRAEFTVDKLTAGRTLAGKSGHGCISCHDISGQSGGGTRGPDLSTTNKRVRYEWYTRWMHQPQRIAPGTKMPQVLIDGQSLLKTVYDGDGPKQLEALWAYFSLGPGLPLPSGMEPPKGVVVSASERPEIMRTFMPDGAGTKCVAVAFPSGMNVVFDSEQGRLAYAWSGNFLEMSNVWNGRGGNQAKTLGPKFWTAPSGNPWSVADSRETPDFDKQAKNPAYGAPLPDGKTYTGPKAMTFTGYSLDTGGNPTFKYRVTPDGGQSTMLVAETPQPAKVTLANGIVRKIVVELPAGKTVWFRAGGSAKEPRIYDGGGKKLNPLDNADGEVSALGTTLVLPEDGDRATVLMLGDAPVGAVWRISKRAGGGYDTMIRFVEPKEKTKAEFSLKAWSLPRDDEKLIQELK